MKRIFLCSLFLLPLIFLFAQQRGMKPILVTVDSNTTTLYKQSHSLLIGVGDYSNGLPPLPGVLSDINDVKAALEKNGFDVTVVMNPDRVGLDKAYNDFIGKYGQDVDSRLLFYYAGHGYTKKMSYGDDLGFLLPSDAVDPNKNPNTFQSKALPMTLIETYALQIQSKHALFLFDACFSGAIFSPSRAIPEAITYKTTQQVRQFITSGSANETVPDQSIFLKQFIRALNGDGDLNKDGFVTGSELGEFLQTNVINYSYNTQHPQYGKIRRQNLDQGDFIFVLNKSGATSTSVITPHIEEEHTLVQYGKLELMTEIGGSLYVDGSYIKKVTANTVFTLKDMTQGEHTIKISGDETVEKNITISTNKTVYLTIDNKQQDVSFGRPCPGMPTITDPRDRQVYPTVQIGTQCWLQKNMNYQAGNSWCYNDNSSNCDVFGRLYDWETALRICPSGWHLPSYEEWLRLTRFLGGKDIAGSKMKEVGTIHWKSPNTGATNSSGFTALPGGDRYYADRFFYNISGRASFWSSSQHESGAWILILGYRGEGVSQKYGDGKMRGFSARCIKN